MQLSHSGHAVARSNGPRVLVLCPAGHLVTSVDQRDWAGSATEARVSGGWWVTCQGTMPNPPIPFVTAEQWAELRARGVVHAATAEGVAWLAEARGVTADPRQVTRDAADAVRLRVIPFPRPGERPPADRPVPVDVWVLATPGEYDLAGAGFRTTVVTETGEWTPLDTRTLLA